MKGTEAIVRVLPDAAILQLSVLGLLLLCSRPVAQGAGTLTSCTEAQLRAAMAGGGLVTFACEGTIALAGTITNAVNTTLDASGHQITISGSDVLRVFYVDTNTTLTIANLTIANGRAEFGAGIHNRGGTVNLRGTTMRANMAIASGGQGGALYNWGGMVNATNCEFLGNLAQSRTNSLTGNAEGGAVFNRQGEVSLHNCIFSGNRASAALASGSPPSIPPVTGANGCGGVVCNLGTLKISFCTFLDNYAKGGLGGEGYPGGTQPPGYDGSPVPFWGGTGGDGYGGAVFSTGPLWLYGCSFVGNLATGGGGGRGGQGGLGLYGATSGGLGGSGGGGFGAALFTSGGMAQIANCTMVSNNCAGGIGGPGGTGGDAVKGDGATGGNGGGGGLGIGVIDSRGDCFITNCTIAFNLGLPGSGGSGGDGGYSQSFGVTAPSGNLGMAGSATGGIQATACRMVNTLLAGNTPGGNGSGTIIDAGHNLSSDATCGFGSEGSLNNTDPKLGALANQGNSTLTLSLRPDSPAIDAGDNAAAPPTDQRGIPRPFGTAPDIGAYEFATLLRVSRSPGHGIDIVVQDGMGVSCCLWVSPNLTNWLPLATNVLSAEGTALFPQPLNTTAAPQFYRASTP